MPAVTRSSQPPEDRRVDPLLEVREKRRGKRPGDAYVRIVRPFEDAFQRGEDEGELIATERTVLERPGFVMKGGEVVRRDGWTLHPPARP